MSPQFDTEALYETMEGKMGEFIAELQQHTSTLLSTICESDTCSIFIRHIQGRNHGIDIGGVQM